MREEWQHQVSQGQLCMRKSTTAHFTVGLWSCSKLHVSEGRSSKHVLGPQTWDGSWSGLFVNSTTEHCNAFFATHLHLCSHQANSLGMSE